MIATPEFWITLALIASATVNALLVLWLRDARRRIDYLTALTQRDWKTVDRMMGITDADQRAFEAHDGSGVS